MIHVQSAQITSNTDDSCWSNRVNTTRTTNTNRCNDNFCWVLL